MLKSVKIAPGAMVCNECELRGDITIGSMTVIHPRASIIAEAGPIIIGECNIVEEQARIVNRGPPGDATSISAPVMVIGANNVFEVDCCSEALKIGDNNILEAKSFVGREVELTNGCIVGAACQLSCSEVVPENTVIYGSKCSRRQQADRPPKSSTSLFKAVERRGLQEFTHIHFGPNLREQQQNAPQTLQLDFLTKVLPNYHHLKKPHKKTSNA